MNIQDLIKNYSFWNYFVELSAIPRPSKHEEQACKWLLDKANAWGLICKRDDFGNILVTVPANDPKLSDMPRVAMQGHIDMVCESNNTNHDFFNQGLDLYVTEDETWVRARETTLGADNGIAIAYQVAFMDPQCQCPHGPLEMLITLDEETGLNGAANLGSDVLSTNYMINIDNSEEAMCCIGCAGGRDYLAELPVLREPVPATTRAYRLEISGLVGGHSGSEIYQIRSNAIKLAERVISEIRRKIPFFVIGIEAGDKRNAIPRSAVVDFYASSKDVATIDQHLLVMQRAIRSELLEVDKNFTITLTNHTHKDASSYQTVAGALALTSRSLDTVIAIMRLCPHGVISRRSEHASGTMLSNNLASIRTSTTHVMFVNNSRYSNDFGKSHSIDLLDSVFMPHDARIRSENSYPAWQAVEDTALEKLFRTSYQQRTGNATYTDIVHGGIECGLIKARHAQNTGSNLEVICIGPEIQFLHSPDERLSIASAENMWHVLCDMVRNVDRLRDT